MTRYIVHYLSAPHSVWIVVQLDRDTRWDHHETDMYFTTFRAAQAEASARNLFESLKQEARTQEDS